MAKKRKTAVSTEDEQTDLLRKLLIVQLGLAGVPQLQIRAIVGGDIRRVSEIMKQIGPKALKAKKKKASS